MMALEVRTVVIAHTADRLTSLERLLNSMIVYPLRGWRLCLAAQGYDSAAVSRLKALPAARVLDFVHFTSELTGPHIAKTDLMDRYPSDVFVSLDDDMEMMEWTEYDTLAALARRPGVGFVQAHSGPSVSSIRRLRARYPEKQMDERALVCTGGGLVFGAATAALIQALPRAWYLFDDVEWPLAAYVAGRLNYRSWRSWAIHRTGRPGGRHTWFRQTVGATKPIPDAALVRFPRKPIVQADKLQLGERVGYPTGVTALAAEKHVAARKAAGWFVGDRVVR